MAKSKKEPSYLALHRSGTLQKRIATATEMLNRCTLCPHKCGVNRTEGELGLCRTGRKGRVASYGAHFGEESPLVGRNGSGTIFFEGCNLHCVFCQNDDISRIDNKGDHSPEAVDDQALAAIMINLQAQGCHNINLVTPSHVVPQFLSALLVAVDEGLRIPIVYNSSGYDSTATLRLLEDIVDIYMPDCKFRSSETAGLYTRADDYPQVMQEALKEMHRQVGDLAIKESGLAWQGILVRHLVMPGHLEETLGVLEFLASEISPATYINIMDQYRPCHRAYAFEKINRSLIPGEYEQALTYARTLGLHRVDQRDLGNLFRMLGL